LVGLAAARLMEITIVQLCSTWAGVVEVSVKSGQLGVRFTVPVSVAAVTLVDSVMLGFAALVMFRVLKATGLVPLMVCAAAPLNVTVDPVLVNVPVSFQLPLSVMVLAPAAMV